MTSARTTSPEPNSGIENFIRRALLALHSLLRREFALVPVAAGRVSSGSMARCRAVAQHIDVVLAVLALQRHAEQHTLWPLLIDRAGEAFAPLQPLMRHEHDEIETVLDDFTAGLDVWRSQVTASTRDGLIGATAVLITALHRHLTDTEGLVIPLLESHMSVDEFQAIMDAHALQLEPSMQHVVLGMLMYESDSQIVDRAAAALAAAGKQRAATDYFHHCQRIHGTGRPPSSAQLFGPTWAQDV